MFGILRPRSREPGSFDGSFPRNMLFDLMKRCSAKRSAITKISFASYLGSR